MLFQQEHKDDITRVALETEPDTKSSRWIGVRSTAASQLWKALTQAERDEWKKKAKDQRTEGAPMEARRE